MAGMGKKQSGVDVLIGQLRDRVRAVTGNYAQVASVSGYSVSMVAKFAQGQKRNYSSDFLRALERGVEFVESKAEE